MKLTSLWTTETPTKKGFVSKPFENNDALIHSPSLALPSPFLLTFMVKTAPCKSLHLPQR